MAASDARPVPRRNVAYRVTLTLLDADGDPVTGATSPDSEVSKDGGTFADCTNEITEIATASGVYFLDLTATEMDADTVAVIVKAGNAKTTVIVMYPESAGDYRADVTHWNGSTVAVPTVAGVPEVDVTHHLGTAVATPTVAGVPEVDVTHLNGDATSLADLKDLVDVGYDPVNNRVDANVVIMGADVIGSAQIAAGAIGSGEAPNLDAAVSSRATPAQVNTEVDDVLRVDTQTLPGQAAPPLSPTLVQAITWLYKALRNRKLQTATLWSLLADDESTVDAKATVSDDGTTAIKSEVVSGP